MRENIIKTKSFGFAIQIVNLNKQLCLEQKEFVLSKQILLSGTSVGAMVREAEHAESKAYFIHKNAIVQKEVNETIYWLELLVATNYISKKLFEELNFKAIELIKMLTSIIKTAKGLNKP